MPLLPLSKQFYNVYKVCNFFRSTIADMSREEIGKICDQIVPELKSIMNGDTYSERHEVRKHSVCILKKFNLTKKL